MKDNKVLGFKGFDKDFKCRGFQYEVGKEYKHEGQVKPCGSGFHYCEDPLDVLGYYELIAQDNTNNRYAQVEAKGGTKDGDKSVTDNLTIKKELTIAELVQASVEFVFSFCFKTESEKKAASGESSKLAASGEYSKLAASGAYSKLAASGESSKLAASGAYSKLAASGEYSKLAASGASSNLAASGASSNLAASGASSNLAASGAYSIAAALGEGSTAKAANGGWIVLAEWAWIGEVWTPICVRSEKVGGDIKADTYYRLEGGKFVEVA